MSRKSSLLIHTARFSRVPLQLLRGASVPLCSVSWPPHATAPATAVQIPIPPPPPPQEKQPYLLHEAAAAPARPAAAGGTAAIPLSLNHCSNKLPFLVFLFIHKGSHRQERQVETTFLLEEVVSLLRNG